MKIVRVFAYQLSMNINVRAIYLKPQSRSVIAQTHIPSMIN